MANNKYLEEIDDELDLEEETPEEQAPMRSQFLSEANDDAQLEYTPEEPLTETELQPSAQERYANVLKQASAAGPRASDYRAAALSRMFSGIGASTPGYLSRMSQTLYHQPDFSWLGAGQKDLADLGDYDIKAKEAEKQRLVDKAAGIRKEALLPGEMAAQEAKSQEVQARLESLKPASQEELAAAEQQLGFKVPPGTTKKKINDLLISQGVSKSRAQPEQPVSDTYRKMVAKQLSRIIGEDVDLTGMSSNEIRDYASIAKFGQITPEDKERIKLAIERNQLAQQALEGTQARAEKKQEEKEIALLVPGLGRALTPDDAKKLKPLAAAQNRLVAGIDDIAKDYGKLKAESVLKSPKTVEQIGVQGKDLVMQFKELYGLGAPQAAELKFLFSLIDSDPVSIGKTLLSDRYAGTSIEQKLNKLKDIVKRNVQEEAKVRLRPEEGSETSPTPTQPKQPAGGKIKVQKGKEVFLISPDKLEAAKAKGYTEVKE
jgi:hypothetical protein